MEVATKPRSYDEGFKDAILNRAHNNLKPAGSSDYLEYEQGWTAGRFQRALMDAEVAKED